MEGGDAHIVHAVPGLREWDQPNRKQDTGGNHQTNIRTTVIYPGKIATELLDSAAEGPGKEAARKAYAAEAIPAGAIEDAVLYAVGQPDSVDVSDIVVRPTAEA